MRWQGRRESDNVEDRRGQSGSPMGGGGGFRLPSGKGGIVLLIIVLVAGYYGVDLTGMGSRYLNSKPPNAPLARRMKRPRNSRR